MAENGRFVAAPGDYAGTNADGRVHPHPHLLLPRCRVRNNASHGVHALDTSAVRFENCLVAENGVNLPIAPVAQSPRRRQCRRTC